MSFSALIMAGGKATRLNIGVEKPLLKFRGKAIIDYIIEAVSIKEIKSITVTVTQNTPETKVYLEAKGIDIINTPAMGYVEDLIYALRKLKPEKVLIITGDLPLIRKKDIRYVLKEYLFLDCPSLAVMCGKEIHEKLGMRADIEFDAGIPVGINVIDSRKLDGDECYLAVTNPRFAVNVNYIGDLKTADKVLEEDENASE